MSAIDYGVGVGTQLLHCAPAGLDSAASNSVTAGALTAAKRPSRRRTARRSGAERLAFSLSDFLSLDMADRTPFVVNQTEATTPALPTVALHMQRLPRGFATTRFRSSANFLYLALEGSGRSVIDGTVFEWQRGDVFVVPCWRPVEHRADSDAILFSATDEPVQRFCGYLREAHGEAAA